MTGLRAVPDPCNHLYGLIRGHQVKTCIHCRQPEPAGDPEQAMLDRYRHRLTWETQVLFTRHEMADVLAVAEKHRALAVEHAALAAELADMLTKSMAITEVLLGRTAT